MDLKHVQQKLKTLRDRIRDQGEISAEDEKELKSLIRQTLEGANSELEGLQGRLSKIVENHQANDNQDKELNEEQKTRLSLMEKTGTGSIAVH